MIDWDKLRTFHASQTRPKKLTDFLDKVSEIKMKAAER